MALMERFSIGSMIDVYHADVLPQDDRSSKFSQRYILNLLD